MSKIHHKFYLNKQQICGLFIIFAILNAVLVQAADKKRPGNWAQPMQLTGVKNLYKINDSLYRCAQPTKAGMEELQKKLGIKTVLNLRSFHSDDDIITTTGITAKEIDMKAFHMEDEDVIKAMKILGDKSGGPYLIHCQQGSDRTGVVCAMYRIIYQGWTKEQAIDEMVNGGYGFHSIWKNIINYIKKADIEKIKKATEVK